MSRLRQDLGIEAPLKRLFEGESLEDFVRLLGADTSAALEAIPLVDRQQPPGGLLCPGAPVVPLATGCRQQRLPHPHGPAPARRPG
nr:hypothetical protein [Pseudomonas chlororaphis]